MTRSTAFRLTPKQVEGVRADILGGEMLAKDIAAKHGVTISTVQFHKRKLGKTKRRVFSTGDAGPRRALDTAVALILAKYPEDRIMAASPTDAVQEYRGLHHVVRETWTEDQWLQSWPIAMATIVRDRFTAKKAGG